MPSTREGGDITVLGFTSGFDGGFSLIDVLSRSLTMTDTAIGPRENFEVLPKALTMHEVRPVIDRAFSIADHRDTYQCLESSIHLGKVAIDVAH